MRTTLNIEDDLYKKVKVKAALEGKKITELIEEGLKMILNNEGNYLRNNRNRKSPTLPSLDRSNGKMLFQGKNVDQIISHLKQLENYEK